MNLFQNEMFQARSELQGIVKRIIPQGDKDSLEAKEIISQMELYNSMVGNLYTSIVHNKICQLLDEYKQKYNIV